MSKITQSGSFLAKHFPTLFKHFSENATQEEFNKAEQEAAVVFQQQTTKPDESKADESTPDATLAALFPTSHKTLAGKLSAEELAAFSADSTEVQNRLTSQASSNQTLSDDLTKTKAELTKATGELTAANTRITDLTPKAAAWDAHKAALDGSNVTGDSTNGKTKEKADNQLSAKDQAHQDNKASLKAKYPRLMADIEVADQE